MTRDGRLRRTRYSIRRTAEMQTGLAMSKIDGIDVLIGRAVLSVESANKLGHVYDLVVHPTKGELAGHSVQVSDQSQVLVSQEEIHSIGPDAVMVHSDQSLVSSDQF